MNVDKYEASIISTFSKMTCYFTNLEPRSTEENPDIARIYQDIFDNNKFGIQDFMIELTIPQETLEKTLIPDEPTEENPPINLIQKILSILIVQ